MDPGRQLNLRAGRRKMPEFPQVAAFGLDNCCATWQWPSHTKAGSFEGKEAAMDRAASSERGLPCEATDVRPVAAAPTGKDALGQFTPFRVSTGR